MPKRLRTDTVGRKKRAKVIKVLHLTFRKRVKEAYKGKPQAWWAKTPEMNDGKHFRR
jgi:hypothetical protein